MIKHVFAAFAFFALSMSPMPILAQDAAGEAPAVAPEATIVAPTEEVADAPQSGDMERKLELSEQMHTFRPAREQIDLAIGQVSELLPEKDRKPFRVAISRMLDYKALERHSIESMAKVFTVEELEAMVDFYSKPEARNISEKLEEYNKLIEPEIFRMLDAAMMEVRTGGAAQ